MLSCYEFALVPTLVDDTNRIMNAQRARGVDFGEGNSLKEFVPSFRFSFLCLPLGFKRADALAIAMEAEGTKAVRDEHAIGLCSGE